MEGQAPVTLNVSKHIQTFWWQKYSFDRNTSWITSSRDEINYFLKRERSEHRPKASRHFFYNGTEWSATLGSLYNDRRELETESLYVWYKDPQAPGPRPRAGISHKHRSETEGELVTGRSRRRMEES